MGERPGRTRPRWMRAAASPMPDEPGGHHRVGGERAAGRVDVDVVAEPERLAQDDLLRGERRVQLGGVDGPFEGPGASRRRAGSTASRSGRGRPRRVRLDAVVDAADPGGALAQLAGRVSPAARITAAAPSPMGGQSPVRSGRTRVAALRDRAAAELGVRVVLGGAPAAGGDAGERAFVGVARVDERLRLEGGEGDRVGPQRGDVVRVELPGQDVAAGRRARTCRSE